MATPHEEAEFEEEDDLEAAVVAAAGAKTNGVGGHGSGAPPAVAAPAATRTGAPKRKAGKHRRTVARGAPSLSTAQVPIGVGAAAASEAPYPPAEEEGGPPRTKDVVALWNYACGVLAQQGMSPGDVFISCARYAIGPVKAENLKTQMSAIDGAHVAGDEMRTPGQMLEDFVTEVYHPYAHGPSRYTFQWFYKSAYAGRQNVAVNQGELILAAPAEIAKMRAAANTFAAGSRGGGAYNGGGGYGGGHAPGPRMAPPPRQGFAGPPPWQSQGYQPAPQYMPAPLPIPAGASPEMVQRLMEAERAAGAYNESLRREGLAPPPPQGPTVQQQAEIVARTLAAMGFTPELAARLNAPATAPATTATVQAVATDPLLAIKALFMQMKQLEIFKRDMMNEFGGAAQIDEGTAEVVEPEIDPSDFKEVAVAKAAGVTMRHGERKEGESNFDYLLRWGTNNPEAIGAAMSVAQKFLTPEMMGKLLQRFTQAGPVHAAAASEVQRGFVDSAASSTPPAATPPNAGPRGWTPGA